MKVASRMAQHLATLVLVCGLAIGCDLGAEEAQRKSLFNGKNLDGWVVTGCQAEVRDGVLFAKGGNGLIRTPKQYEDFTFELD